MKSFGEEYYKFAVVNDCHFVEACFNTLKECRQYIYEQMKNDQRVFNKTFPYSIHYNCKWGYGKQIELIRKGE